jgi:dienelactone hydrolase
VVLIAGQGCGGGWSRRMRALELSIVFILLAYVVYILSPSRPDYFWLSLTPFLCLPVVAVHFLLEGYRWQMLPVYAVLCAAVLYKLAPQFKDVQVQYLAGLAALACLGLGVILSTALPVFELPTPTGPHPVGTQTRYLVDANRRNLDDSGGPRELMVQIWYPAGAATRGKIARYRESAITSVRDARFALVKTHSIVDAPLAESRARFPLLLYAPSWDGVRTENTFQAEELASHGYIVVGIDHPYSSLATIVPDGRVIGTRLLDDDFYSSEATFGRFLKTAETEIRFRADDARFVLDTFQHLDATDPKNLFAGHLDLDRVGIFGFSLGGGVAAQACWLDLRLKACANMDGMMAGESLEQGTRAPFLIMSEHDPPPPDSVPDASPAKRRELALDWTQFVQMRKLLSTHGGYWLSIDRAKHSNFSDYVFSSPLRRYSHSGPIGPTNAARIINQYLRAFFDRHLMDIDAPMLDENYPRDRDVRFEQLVVRR